MQNRHVIVLFDVLCCHVMSLFGRCSTSSHHREASPQSWLANIVLNFVSFSLFVPFSSRISLSQQVEKIAHNYCIKDVLDHPILQPLAELLKRELGVLRAACKVKDARNATAVQYEGIVLSLLDFRDAITSWQGANRGEVCLSRPAPHNSKW